MSRTHVESKETTFINNFWGDKDAALEVIQTRIRHSLKTLHDLLDFYHEKINIEKEYNKRLERLNSKIPLGSHETSTLKVSLEKLSLENKQMVKNNQKYISSISQINLEKLESFYSTYHKKVGKIDGHMSKIASKRKECYDNLQKYKKRYQEDCSQVKSLKLLAQTTWGKELEKNTAKLNKVASASSSTRKQYQQAIENYKKYDEMFVRDWSIALQDFYQLEIERVQACKINCFTYCNHIATQCVDNDHSADLARSSFAQVTPAQDLQEFGSAYGTGNKLYDPPEFVDFMNGYYDTEEEPSFKIAEFEDPDVSLSLSRSYSVYSQNIPKSSPSKTSAGSSTKKKQLPPIIDSEEVPILPQPAEKSILPTPNENLNIPIRKSPLSENSIHSGSPEDNKNDVFSLHENGKSHKFTNSNGSSNYSNPTNYSSSNYSGSERNWASPRRKEKQLSQFQEQINLKSKELPQDPTRSVESSDLKRQSVPILKDFSVDFIAKALEDLNSGGDGDINHFRRSVRQANEAEQRAKTAPNSPYKNLPVKTGSDVVDDHDEEAVRYGSSSFVTPLRNSRQNAAATEDGSPIKIGRKPRPKSMFEPLAKKELPHFPVPTDEEVTFSNNVGHTPRKSLDVNAQGHKRTILKSPTKSYTNLHSLVKDPRTDMTAIGRKAYILKARAMYTYKPQQHGELFFRKGWLMYIIHKQEDNWFVCELASNCNDRAGMVGLVPGNYVYEKDDLF